MITKEERARVGKLLDEATPAPWTVKKEMMTEDGYEQFVKGIEIRKGSTVVANMKWNNPLEANAYLISKSPTWLRQYEDTVTELEGRLEQAVRLLNNTFKEGAVKGCGCHECGELREIRKFINSLSQLEKGDKDNADKKTATRT